MRIDNIDNIDKHLENGSWWLTRLWEVRQGHPLTNDEAIMLSTWVTDSEYYIANKEQVEYIAIGAKGPMP